MPENSAPAELEHGIRHAQAALVDWQEGKYLMASTHLREAVADLAWALYQAAVLVWERD